MGPLFVWAKKHRGRACFVCVCVCVCFGPRVLAAGFSRVSWVAFFAMGLFCGGGGRSFAWARSHPRPLFRYPRGQAPAGCTTAPTNFSLGAPFGDWHIFPFFFLDRAGWEKGATEKNRQEKNPRATVSTLLVDSFLFFLVSLLSLLLIWRELEVIRGPLRRPRHLVSQRALHADERARVWRQLAPATHTTVRAIDCR